MPIDIDQIIFSFSILFLLWIQDFDDYRYKLTLI